MSQDYPTIEWGPGTDPAGQKDMCVAVSSNQPRQLEVPLEFHHATSQVYFAANYIELEEGEYIIIDSVILHNLIGSKHVTIVKDAPYVDWEPDGTLPRTQDYRLGWKEGDPNSTLKSDVQLVMRSDYPDGVEITNDRGTLFLVPQTYFAETKNVEITVKYTLWQLDELISPVPFIRRQTTMEGILPPCTWEPDTRYRYILTLNDKTNVLAINLHVDYNVQPAKFYAMTNSMSLPEASSVVGSTNFELVATVGPKSLSTGRKEVEWEVENYVSESNKLENEFIKLSANVYDDVEGTNTVKVTCKKVTTTPVKITARTKIAESDDDKLESYCMFSVTPAGVGLNPLTMDPEYTGW